MATVNPIRIRLRYADMETFVEKFAPNVTRGGVFLASRNIQPIGTVVPFEIQLLGGETALSGEGRVSWTKEFNPSEPNRPYGMGMQFVNIAPASKSVLARLLQARQVGGAGRGTTTGPLAPLGASTSADAAGTGPNGNAADRQPAQGKAAAVSKPIDTSVDLAAEYGVAEPTMRRLMERKWLMGARANDDDLSDLLRPEPVEAVTLSQALSELPRLLDPQYSRRRTSSALRSLDWRGSPAQPLASAIPPANQQAEPTAQNGQDEGIVPQTTPSVAVEGGEEEAGDDTGRNAGAVELHERTDMTGEHELETSLHALPAVPAATSNGHGDRKRR